MTAQDTTTRSSALSAAQGTILMAKREVVTTARTPAFIWSFVIMVVIVLLFTVGQKFLGDIFAGSMGVSTSDQRIATTVDGLEGLDGFEVTKVESADAAAELLHAGEIDAAVLSSSDAAGLELYEPMSSEPLAASNAALVVVGDEEFPSNVVDALTMTPATGMLSPAGNGSGFSPMITYFLGIAFGMVFMMGVMLYANRIAQTVVEEKASRIVELLLVTVSPRTILAGKVIGGTVLAVAQVAVLVLVALVGLAATDQLGDFGDLVPALLWFGALFTFGFVLFAAMYAAVASTVSRPEDVPNATGTLAFLAMVPYMLVIVFNTNSTMMTWLSYIPFSSPVAMPVRVTTGDALWWEPIVALLVLAATTLACLALGAKIYENTVLRTGKVKMADAIRGK